MYGTKLCIAASGEFGIDVKDQIKLFHDTGFEGFFLTGGENVDIGGIKRYADSIGMIFQSVHAPYGKSADMWESGEKAECAVKELLDCLKTCDENDIPIMVCHTIIGFDKHTPNSCGIENYRRVVEAAEKTNVKIAFENTEGEEYLEALMKAFRDYDNVGFCWDTGHEMCYNRSKDMMALYGDRLICTHLNDNLGIKSYDGEIGWTDDLHLLPFDGAADWKDIVHRLNKYGYNDILTFELNMLSKPNRHENDAYEKMGLEQYVCEAYKRACRVAMYKANDKKAQNV